MNSVLARLFNSTVSQNRAAKILGINRKTSVRKFRFLAKQGVLQQARFLKGLEGRALKHIQFDDLETSEHSKCKPLSVALAVEPKSRKILSFHVSQMPARGPLAEIARRKYGYRRDERSAGWTRLMRDLQPIVAKDATFVSDENPHYPRFVRRFHPKATHEKEKGRRGCITGQEELKKIGFDPLFSLNHTCAMLRANMNRLIRRTWCTTKNRQGLLDHLAIYIAYHNSVLTPPIPLSAG